jgi:catechol 2,3-dioxygenase-like lactoylglutathione lyase family enzyme
MTSQPQIAHFVAQTRQMSAMVDWYAKVFGARPVHANPAMTFMTFDDEHHRFAFLNLDIIAPGGPGIRGDIGVNHIAWTLPSAAALLSRYRDLKAHGILPVWPVHHGLTLSLYYADPDGNQTEFQVEALPAGEAAIFITGPQFAADPIGVAFDPEDLVARFEAGATEAELLTRPDGPATFPPAMH